MPEKNGPINQLWYLLGKLDARPEGYRSYMGHLMLGMNVIHPHTALAVLRDAACEQLVLYGYEIEFDPGDDLEGDSSRWNAKYMDWRSKGKPTRTEAVIDGLTRIKETR